MGRTTSDYFERISGCLKIISYGYFFDFPWCFGVFLNLFFIRPYVLAHRKGGLILVLLCGLTGKVEEGLLNKKIGVSL